MFNLQNPENKKIFLHLPQMDSTAPKNHHVHFGVTCDNCESGPIIGFRYKCMECEDFDVCAACEGKMAHAQHVMLRLPGDIKQVTGKAPHIKRRHGHGHHGKKHSRCPISFGGGILNTIEDLNLQAALKNSERQSSSSGEASPKKDDPTTHNKKYEEHMKTSMDMLSNFHQMFAKILDPLGADITVDIRNESNVKEKEKEPTTENEKVSAEKEQVAKIVAEENKMDEAAGGSSTSIHEDSNWEVIHKERSSSPEVIKEKDVPMYPELRAVLIPEKVAPATANAPATTYPEMRAVLVTDCGSKMDLDDKADDDKAKIAQEETNNRSRIYHSSEFLNKIKHFTI